MLLCCQSEHTGKQTCNWPVMPDAVVVIWCDRNVSISCAKAESKNVKS